jgi:type I restriction enzyme S subunit
MGGELHEWRDCKLGDVLELKRGYDLPSQHRQPGSVPIVSSSGSSGFHAEAMVKAPGVVTGRYGTLGEVFFVTRDFWPLNTTLYVRDFKGSDPKFISYFLKTLDIYSCSDKAAVPGVNRNHLHELPVRVPPLAEQRAIARILGALDDKIELNRKMNETLEAIARALFKSWFVQEPEPDWKTAPLAEWVDVLSGGTPSKSNAALWGGPLKWISPKAMTSIHADECDEHVSEQAVGNGTRIAPKGSTLVMVRGMGLHDGVRVSQARETVTFNQDVKALVPKNIEADLLLFAMLDAQEELHKRVETSGHGTGKMPSEILLSHPITMPSLEVQRERAVHISALNDQIGANRSESRSLARVLDELLPRLLSGALPVDAAERAVEEVA